METLVTAAKIYVVFFIVTWAILVSIPKDGHK